MIDLSGPDRLWPAALIGRFGDALTQAMSSRGCWSTPHPFGDAALLDRLGELVNAPQGRTLVTAGVRSFAAAWAGRTRASIIERPTFSDIPNILGGSGTVRAEPWESALRLAALCREPVTVWVTSPARNPDGRSLDAATLGRLTELADHGHHVVVNQVYRWFAQPDQARPVLWTVTSLAKLCGGGSRLGWATLPSAGLYPPGLRACGPATVWQRAWAAFLSSGVLADLRSSCVEPTLEARGAFVERAKQLLGWHVGGEGPSLVLRCAQGRCSRGQGSQGQGSDGAEQHWLGTLADAGILVSPGSAFAMPVPSLRLAFSGVGVAEARLAADRIGRLLDGGAPELVPFGP